MRVVVLLLGGLVANKGQREQLLFPMGQCHVKNLLVKTFVNFFELYLTIRFIQNISSNMQNYKLCLNSL
jgi:hypothetical protein